MISSNLQIVESMLAKALDAIINEDYGVKETLITLYKEAIRPKIHDLKGIATKRLYIIPKTKDTISIVTRCIDLSINSKQIILFSTSIYDPLNEVVYEYPRMNSSLGGYAPSFIALRSQDDNLLLSKFLVHVPHRISIHSLEYILQFMVLNIWLNNAMRTTETLSVITDTPILTLGDEHFLKLKLDLLKQLSSKNITLISVNNRLSISQPIMSQGKSALDDISVITSEIGKVNEPISIGPISVKCNGSIIYVSYIIIPISNSRNAFKYLVFRLETLKEAYDAIVEELGSLHLESWLATNYLIEGFRFIKVPKDNVYRVLKKLILMLRTKVEEKGLTFTCDSLYVLSQIKDLENYMYSIL